MQYLLNIIVLMSIGWTACPVGYYEDDCGTCWMPYCYEYETNSVSYDLEETECDSDSSAWVIPGSQGDPFFNNYCDGSCPDNFLADDCDHCWSGFCYSFFDDGLNGDPAHSVYYDLSIQECEGYGYNYYAPDNAANPDWNSNCVSDCTGNPGGDAVEDCAGMCDGDAMIDDCGDCQQSYCYDYATNTVNFEADYACDGDTEMFVEADSPSNPYWNASEDQCGICNGPGYSFTGNANEDCELNVLDIVAMVQIIINGAEYNYDADMTGDGIINILDVVNLLSVVLGTGSRTSDAGSATMIVSDNSVSLSADGYIGGVQMTLTHGQGFTLNLTNDAMFAEYKTSGTSTILIIVEPQDELLFTTNQSFDIAESIVANSSGAIMVDTVSEFGLSAAYPNPFNPATTVTLTVPSADHVSVKVYNLMGQMVGTLADGMMEANVYSFTWDASSVSSGVYLIRAESSASVDIQKVLLVK